MERVYNKYMSEKARRLLEGMLNSGDAEKADVAITITDFVSEEHAEYAEDDNFASDEAIISHAQSIRDAADELIRALSN